MFQNLLRSGAQQILHVVRDDARMARVEEGIRFFLPEVEVLTFPAWDCLPYDRVSPNHAIISQRMETLARLAEEQQPRQLILLTTVNALLQRVLSRQLVQQSLYHASAGQELDRERLTQFLVTNGYTRVGKVMEQGEFALRGSIMDIFAPGSEEAYRLDFFGETLESIRVFDPLSQVSEGRRDSFTLLPAGEVILTEDSIRRFRSNYRELFGAVSKEDPLYEAVSSGRKYPGMEHWQPLFYERMDLLTDYLPDAVVCYDYLAEEAIRERQALIEDYYQARVETKKAPAIGGGAPYHPLPPERLYLMGEEPEDRLADGSRVYFSPFKTGEETATKDAGYRRARDFSPERSQKDINIFYAFHENAASQQREGKRVCVCCFTEGSRERMATMLTDHELQVRHVAGWQELQQLPVNMVGLVVLGLEQGFTADGYTFFSEQDILGDRIARPVKKKRRPEDYFAEASTFSEGEPVVHQDHGIGRFEGLVTVETHGAAHDCLKLIYDGGDRLFVPVENIEVISRYGSEELEVSLDKLGGVAWQQRKAKLKKRIRMMADELLKVAAERELKQAPQMQPPASDYDEFCARFPYAETDDQLRAIEETLDDLSTSRPMDRLICGDAGFGKTEVALRAAFAAVAGSGRQVAVVVPTTLLSRQHFRNFQERFEGLGYSVRQLSRLVSDREATKTRAGLADGSVDIVVGTHALLSSGIKFKDLGLLIIDEEQHFGVKQKERLKQLKSNVHVLTLSATPIPRTLQLAMAGVRDLSLITTPPVDRLAVRTFVMPVDEVVIREAILREHYRGGKSFYVAPRIKDLDELTPKLKALVPEVKIGVAHGQMTPQQLDDIMTAFDEGKFDVLLSTAIVESGLDIPSANTMIVHRSDMFGLGQLYQLRGRVGRGKIRAYAYLTLPHGRQLTKQAIKRLEVMQTLDTLGIGFSIASHDMDIRGFGNLLGEEQSGNIKEVGAELYQQMLTEAVDALKEHRGEEVEEEAWSPQINIGVEVLIPAEYVEDVGLRLGLYRRLSGLKTPEEIEGFAVELVDRFGPMPVEVEHLLAVTRIKQLCREAGVERVDAGPRGLVIAFHNQTFARPEKLIEFIAKNPATAKIRPDQSLVLTRDWEKPESRLKGVDKSLKKIVELAA